ncbi:MAG: bifunctional riboflavin kinase/FAD synthetase [Clostridia bacterium]|nr:bifunctional riboflavin kinase/FAD synthetase [Clostridia bacterium]
MANSKKAVVAIGKFDGVHKGHQELLSKAAQISETSGFECVALVINSMRGQYLTADDERNEIIKSFGIEKLEIQNLTPDFMNMCAEEFVCDFLIKKLNCAHVVVGYNFRFAKGRTADASLLEEICMENNIDCTIIPEVKCSVGSDKVTASSSNIRDYLFNGDVDFASEILGRPFCLSGEVVRGKQIGRTINAPTANINCRSVQTFPKPGVYATRVRYEDKTYISVTNIGDNPTVSSDGQITIETHIIDFAEDIYGKSIKIEFVKRIRDQIKFNSLEELKQQIEKDIEASIKISVL